MRLDKFGSFDKFGAFDWQDNLMATFETDQEASRFLDKCDMSGSVFPVYPVVDPKACSKIYYIKESREKIIDWQHKRLQSTLAQKTPATTKPLKI